MEKKYFGTNALAYFTQLVKTALNGKANASHSHTKSEITDYSDYTLPTASDSTLGGVKVGAGLSINDGVLSANGGGTADSVDWSNVQNKPTKVSQFTNDSGFQTESDVNTLINSKVSSVMRYKGTVESISDLPTNATIGDTYNITTAGDNNKAGDNASWNGTAWDILSGTIDLSGYVESSDLTEVTNSEIDTLWNA